MSGYCTMEVALFIRGTDTALQEQARNWLAKHMAGNFSKTYEFIRTTDPDNQAARFVGFAFTTDPGTFSAIQRLAAKPAFAQAKLRFTQRSRKKLKQMIRDEMAAADPPWRIKPKGA